MSVRARVYNYFNKCLYKSYLFKDMWSDWIMKSQVKKINILFFSFSFWELGDWMVYFHVMVELRSAAMVIRAMRQELCFFFFFFFQLWHITSLCTNVFSFFETLETKTGHWKTADFKSHGALRYEWWAWWMRRL